MCEEYFLPSFLILLGSLVVLVKDVTAALRHTQ